VLGTQGTTNSCLVYNTVIGPGQQEGLATNFISAAS
jgi:hypothetical protein